MFYEDLSIEGCIDELKSVRDTMKILKQKEDELKNRIIADGRSEIKGENHIMKKSVRTKEVFNETAFIETFMNDSQFDKDFKDSIVEMQPKLNQENLNAAVKDNKISLDYVIPFNSITESVVITVK